MIEGSIELSVRTVIDRCGSTMFGNTFRSEYRTYSRIFPPSHTIESLVVHKLHLVGPAKVSDNRPNLVQDRTSPLTDIG